MKTLKDIAQTGDIVFLIAGHSFWSSIIRFFTGDETHVFLVYDSTTIYETEYNLKKSAFSSIDRYNHRRMRVFRIKNLTEAQRQRIQDVCRLQLGTPYSYLAFVVQALFNGLPRKQKDFINDLFDNKKNAKCDQSVVNVLNSALDDDFWIKSLASNPHELRKDVTDNPNIEEVFNNFGSIK